ncbi:hypothetical protein [Streptomyces sp. ID05-39B]|uniref:hypothetical protein n=1 Tax=Streptomyces sp. ID05-39B TaxID=3028664 RepID=UPI0029C008EF|nr:hypothetical protein [Streptomyces sp. ID05-39B]
MTPPRQDRRVPGPVRPVRDAAAGGGRERPADPTALRPATAQERLSAGVHAAHQRARTDVHVPFLVGVSAPRPPAPAPGCADCLHLATRRAQARATRDHSAETDANVLLSGYRRQGHRP